MKGSHFRRVQLPEDSPRRGLLGHGSVLAVTSRADRTSPVVRGQWILENLLGAEPPPPPANVPPLDATNVTDGQGAMLSLRERLTAHRENPTCASCHLSMDSLGFALEGFDAVGRWRAIDELGDPIDASGILPDGSTFQGFDEFRAALLSSELFRIALAEKLMTYALGRGIEHYDMPAVRAIVRDAADEDHRFSQFILGVVNSTPFQMRRTALDHYQTSLAATHVLERRGRGDRPAAARRDGARVRGRGAEERNASGSSTCRTASRRTSRASTTGRRRTSASSRSSRRFLRRSRRIATGSP